MELFNVITVQEAKKKLDEIAIEIKRTSNIPIDESLNRICASEIISSVDVPAFRRSTVDGYAVKSKDTAGASESIPAIMNLLGDIEMGEKAQEKIEKVGECLYVPTGGMIPDGADSMVMIEYTEKMDENTILINKGAAHGDRVVQVGEDVELGEKVMSIGTTIRPYEIGLLSSIGESRVDVYEKPIIGVISTGDEIVSCDEMPEIGQVRDMNSFILKAAVQEDGFKAVDYGVAKDTFGDLEGKVNSALKECDIVLISGGSSVGKKDQTLKVIDSLEDSDVLAHGISIKPGKPTIVGKVKDKMVFGLPGHPLSCAVVYKIIVKHYINRLIQVQEKKYPVRCEFPVNYHNASGREEYLPVMLEYDSEGRISANPVFSKSGLITGFTKAWGYVIIPKNDEGLKKGQEVLAYKF